MPRWGRLLLAALTASAVLGVAVATATAQSGLSTGGPTIRGTWSSLSFEAAGTTVRCGLTLEGSFHGGVIAKTANLLLGYVSRASLQSPCTGGTATVLSETQPWHMTYESFTGTLPAITRIRMKLINASFRIRPTSLGVECLARSRTEAPVKYWAERATETGVVRSLVADETAGIPLTGSFTCSLAGSGHISGTGSLTRLGATERIVVSLI